MDAITTIGLGGKIVDILILYIKIETEKFVEINGAAARKIAESLLITLKMRLGGDQTAIDMLGKFEKNPDMYKPILEEIVQKKIEQDNSFAIELGRSYQGFLHATLQYIKINEIIRNNMSKNISKIQHSTSVSIRANIGGELTNKSEMQHSTSVSITTNMGGEPVPVLLGVSAPRAVRSGDVFTARLVAYIKSLEEKVKQELSELSRGRSESYLGVANCRWKLNTHVIVKLSGRHLKVNPSESKFVWNGEHNLVNFIVEVLPDAPEDWTILQYEVFIDGIRIAFIPLDLEIAPNIKSGKRSIDTIEPAHTAFASYASQDRARVLDRVAAVSISAGLNIFLDCLSIHPGEEWKKKLESEIESRDIFLLFWSAHAKNSEWVAWEWKTALVKKGESAIQLHPLQTATEAPPPDELKKFHFGDVYMIVRDAQERKD